MGPCAAASTAAERGTQCPAGVRPNRMVQVIDLIIGAPLKWCTAFKGGPAASSIHTLPIVLDGYPYREGPVLADLCRLYSPLRRAASGRVHCVFATNAEIARAASPYPTCSKKCGARTVTRVVLGFICITRSPADSGTIRSCDARRYKIGTVTAASRSLVSTSAMARNRARIVVRDVCASEAPIIKRRAGVLNCPSSARVNSDAGAPVTGATSTSGAIGLVHGRGLLINAALRISPRRRGWPSAARATATGPEKDSPSRKKSPVAGRARRAWAISAS